MAGYNGIANINGVAIGNIAKMTGLTKQSVWNIASAPRESNLYQSLTTNAWASFTIGVNYASFVAVGASGSNAEAYFTDTNHSAGDTYNFSFIKTGGFGARNVEVRVATNTSLLDITGGGSTDVGAMTGSQSFSISTTSTNTTMYIGFIGVNVFSGTLDISNFIVTKS
jgi:hypothetical protein